MLRICNTCSGAGRGKGSTHRWGGGGWGRSIRACHPNKKEIIGDPFSLFKINSPSLRLIASWTEDGVVCVCVCVPVCMLCAYISYHNQFFLFC